MRNYTRKISPLPALRCINNSRVRRKEKKSLILFYARKSEEISKSIDNKRRKKSKEGEKKIRERETLEKKIYDSRAVKAVK